MIKKKKIGIVGLGYVGLPLALAMSERYSVLGFDINKERISSLQEGFDENCGSNSRHLKNNTKLSFTKDIGDLAVCNIFIITVPTPVDEDLQPKFDHLIHATKLVGSILKNDDIVIYESTVHPGATEEICAPILAEASGLILNKEFTIGYSPERVSPDDSNRQIKDIIKVVSASRSDTADLIDSLYRSVITAGTYLAPSIKVAEAAKIVENIQRDVNIALMNELSMVFSRLKIDTTEVLDTASTKWNFIRLSPGFVGGHCISVDPYYFISKAKLSGYIPDIIQKSREVNEGMVKHSVEILLNLMAEKNMKIKKSKILILGVTFKENCKDIRNSKIAELVSLLTESGAECDVYDHKVNSKEVYEKMHVKTLETMPAPEDSIAYEVLVLAVPHQEFIELGSNNLKELLIEDGIFFDVKSVFPKKESTLRL